MGFATRLETVLSHLMQYNFDKTLSVTIRTFKCIYVVYYTMYIGDYIGRVLADDGECGEGRRNLPLGNSGKTDASRL